MDNDDWGKLLKLLQRELRKVGKFNIADIDNYEVDERKSNKKLAQEMFIALHTELVTRSPELLDFTLKKFGEYVKDGDPYPTDAVMRLDPDRTDPDAPEGDFNYISLRNNDVSYAIKYLEDIYLEIFKTEIPGAEK